MTQEEMFGKIMAAAAKAEAASIRTEKMVQAQAQTIASLAMRVGELEEKIGYLIGIASKALDQAVVVNEKFRQLTRDENDDTDPQAPESLRAAHRMISHYEEDEDRPSLLTQSMNVQAGPVTMRGPAVVIGSVVAMIVSVLAVLAVTHQLPPLFH